MRRVRWQVAAAVAATVGLLAAAGYALRLDDRAAPAASLGLLGPASTTGSPAIGAPVTAAPAFRPATTAAPATTSEPQTTTTSSTTTTSTTTTTTTTSTTSTTSTTTTTSRPAVTTSRTVSVTGSTEWACRQGATQAGLVADVTGTVCARRVGAIWEGRASVTVTSRGPVIDGTADLVFNVVPEEPRFAITSATVHIPARGSVTLPLAIKAAMTATDTGGWFSWDLQANWGPGNGAGPGAELASPIVWTAARPAGTPSRSTASSTPVCQQGRITAGITAEYRYCIRQVGGRLLGSGTLTYRTVPADLPLFLTVGQAVNTDRNLFPGQSLVSTRIASTSVQLPPTTTTTTVTLPPIDSQLLTTDASAVSYSSSGTTAVLSPVLTLH